MDRMFYNFNINADDAYKITTKMNDLINYFTHVAECCGEFECEIEVTDEMKKYNLLNHLRNVGGFSTKSKARETTGTVIIGWGSYSPENTLAAKLYQAAKRVLFKDIEKMIIEKAINGKYSFTLQIETTKPRSKMLKALTADLIQCGYLAEYQKADGSENWILNVSWEQKERKEQRDPERNPLDGTGKPESSEVPGKDKRFDYCMFIPPQIQSREVCEKQVMENLQKCPVQRLYEQIIKEIALVGLSDGRIYKKIINKRYTPADVVEGAVHLLKENHYDVNITLSSSACILEIQKKK